MIDREEHDLKLKQNEQQQGNEREKEKQQEELVISELPQPQDSSSSDDFDGDDANQKFDLSSVKPLDLKGRWLGDTQQVLEKFETKLQELHAEKKRMQEGFQTFAQNEDRFRLSAARKLVFSVDRQALYREFMLNSRRTFEKLHPALVLTIASYAEDTVFLGLARLRRVSQVFNLIYGSSQVVELVGERELGEGGVGLAEQERWCCHYLRFREAFLYYKEIRYTVLIPQNSIQEDLEAAVDFINAVYKQVYRVRTPDIDYFRLLNRFMLHHRVPIALQSLSFTDLAVTRKAAVVALSNFLALNPGARRKEEISKTKCLVMVRMVEDEHYRSSLLINGQLSNFLQEAYDFPFAVFIDTLRAPCPPDFADEPFFDLAVCHNHNELRSFLVRGIPLSPRIEMNAVELQFAEDLSTCLIAFRVGERSESEQVIAEYLPTVQANHFGHCLVYRGEFYCVLLIRPLYEAEPE